MIDKESHQSFFLNEVDLYDLYQGAQEQSWEGTHVISMDEMTGVQALECKYLDKLYLPGQRAPETPMDICMRWSEHEQVGSLSSFRGGRLRAWRGTRQKRKNGILKSMEIWSDFLRDPSHRIRFVYTPKHSSWMNQIEIWFGIINRKLL